MEEQRTVSRQRTLKAGKIIVSAKSSQIDCTVRNLSPKGALLIVSNLAGIVPPRFQLMLESNQQRHDCRVIWRGSDRVGVEFADWPT